MFFVSSKIEKNIKITSGRRSATEEAARLRQSTRTPFIGWGGNRECVCYCVCSVLLLLPYILDLLWVFSSFFFSSRWRSRCRFLIVSGLGRRKVKETGWYWRLFSLTCGSRFTWNAVIISPLFRCEAMEWRDKSHSQRERERESCVDDLSVVFNGWLGKRRRNGSRPTCCAALSYRVSLSH